MLVAAVSYSPIFPTRVSFFASTPAHQVDSSWVFASVAFAVSNGSADWTAIFTSLGFGEYHPGTSFEAAAAAASAAVATARACVDDKALALMTSTSSEEVACLKNLSISALLVDTTVFLASIITHWVSPAVFSVQYVSSSAHDFIHSTYFLAAATSFSAAFLDDLSPARFRTLSAFFRT